MDIISKLQEDKELTNKVLEIYDRMESEFERLMEEGKKKKGDRERLAEESKEGMGYVISEEFNLGRDLTEEEKRRVVIYITGLKFKEYRNGKK